jgi:hypothetical protein
MRLGAGHPAGPFDVLAALPEEERTRLSVALPPAGGRGSAGRWPMAQTSPPFRSRRPA